MANYTLINSNVLSSSAATVTFSSIPATYTDLVLRASIRNDDSGTITGVLRLQVNGLSSSIYSFTALYGNGSASSSARASATTDITDIYLAGNLTDANTFGIVEIYIPNYAGTAKKPVASYGASEGNTSPSPSMAANAGLIDLTSAITSISLLNNSTKQFLTSSSFYLYGISNA
jgi:hypothetical protein